MKTLGIKQFDQMTFKLMDLTGSKFKDTLGKVPKYFTAVIKGASGNGKTEFCVQLAKELTKHGKVQWLSYEQRHGFDLQEATRRNNMIENSGKFLVTDPLSKIPEGVSLLEDVVKELKKRGTADYVFFDSLDYTGWKWEDYLVIKNVLAPKKGLIFICHSSKTGTFKKRVCDQVAFDGGMTLLVKDFICYPEKNRFGGFEPYIIYEKMARERNPLFFEKRLKESTGKTPKKSKGTPEPSNQLTIDSPEAQISTPTQK